jgi:acyl-CoA synthetase (AMP-forming)/AMP-acid ligase II
MSQHASLVDLLQCRARLAPERCAYSYLPDGSRDEVQLTYGQLHAAAQTIARHLQDQTSPGDRVLLSYPPGLEFIAAFFGTLYAGLTAVPACSPHPSRIVESLAYIAAIAADAQTAVVLSTSPTRALAEPHAGAIPELASCLWLATDELPANNASHWRDPGTDPEALAVLQYTSGSTRTPHGVMVSHGNILENSSAIQQAFENTPDSQGVIWLPHYHDMGLIGGIVQPLYAGFPVTLMSPVSFMLRPLRWLEAVSRSQATVSGGPNFAYDVCVRKIRPEQRAGLDLSRWQVAFVGAEPVRHETLERFADAFGPCGFRRESFYPCYGLAEATLIVTGGDRSARPVIRTADPMALGGDRHGADAVCAADARTLVGCGRPRPGQELAIVDPYTRTPSAPGQAGEIWVRGPNVARGYWQRSAETNDTFRATLNGSGKGPFLRTGDLGFLDDDELFVVGRLKDLIIVGGRNHAAEDIERTVQHSHPALAPHGCVAFSVDVDGEERLVIAAERSRRDALDLATVAGRIRQAVADRHDVRVHHVAWLKPAGLPKTTSGKVQRQACRRMYLSGDLEPITEC